MMSIRPTGLLKKPLIAGIPILNTFGRIMICPIYGKTGGFNNIFHGSKINIQYRGRDKYL